MTGQKIAPPARRGGAKRRSGGSTTRTESPDYCGDLIHHPACGFAAAAPPGQEGRFALLADQLDHVLHAAAESPLVVVPGEDFNEILSQRFRQRSIHYR